MNNPPNTIPCAAKEARGLSVADGGGARSPRRDVLLGLSGLLTTHLLGCGGDDAQTAAAATSGSGGGSAGDPYFPPMGDDWDEADPGATGWSADGLAALLAVVEENDSSSFTMLAGGRLLVEAYFLGTSASTQLDVASVQKSFTSTLVGLARDQGLLQLDDAVSEHLPDGWSNATPTQEALITLRHLMTHSSGLNPNTLKKVAEPGTVFDYNTKAYQKLRRVLEQASGLDINALSQAWLFEPIGVGGQWVDRGLVDSTGDAIWGLKLSARDMARFGLLAQRTGAWAGKQVTGEDWFAEAWTRSATKPDYGLLWWLQGKGSLGAKGAPADLVSALGARDQKIYVVPSLDLVVTRQGEAAGAQTEYESDFDAVLLKAIGQARA